MRVCPISFTSSESKVPLTHEEMENQALLKLWNYWNETGDFRPARIDFFEEHNPVITMIGEPPKKPVEEIIKHKKGFNILKFIRNLFSHKI